MIVLIHNIIRLFLLLLVQIFILNNIHFLGFVNPYIYILAIMMWPVRFDRKTAMLLALGIGLVIDSFNNTPGIHTAAALLAAYLRNPVINLFVDIEEGNNPTPSIRSFGIAKFINYAVVIIFVHHFTLFFLEAFSFEHFGLTLLRIVINSLVTLTIILGIQSFIRE